VFTVGVASLTGKLFATSRIATMTEVFLVALVLASPGILAIIVGAVILIIRVRKRVSVHPSSVRRG